MRCRQQPTDRAPKSLTSIAHCRSHSHTLSAGQDATWRRACPAILCLALCVTMATAGDHDDVYADKQLPEQFTDREATQRSMVFVGDIMTWERSAACIRQHGPTYPFAALQDLLERADLAIGNLEGPIAIQADLGPGTPRYKVPPFTLEGLQEAGIDLLCMANNHLMDCGPEGLAETLNHLQQADLRAFGAGRNLERAAQAAILSIGETTVAFVGAVCPETYFQDREDAETAGEYEDHARTMHARLQAGANRPGSIVATPQRVAWLVRSARNQADLVVFSLHGGIRYNRLPTPRQRFLARIAVLAGADLVVGHHAHFWQPVEVYRGVPILYGLGNVAFGSGNSNADEGLLARVILEGDHLASIELFPLYTKNRDPDVNYQTKVLADPAAEKVITQLSALSAPLAADIVYRDGRGILSLKRRQPPPG